VTATGTYSSGIRVAGASNAVDLNRNRAVVGRAVTELSRVVITPALDPSTREKSTGVVIAGADRYGIRDPADCDRSSAYVLVIAIRAAVIGDAVAELPVIVIAQHLIVWSERRAQL